MLKTIQGVVDDQGNIRLEGEDKLTTNQRVLVVYEENDDDFVGGYPASLLLARPALTDWDRPEEDEAWKDFQDEAK